MQRVIDSTPKMDRNFGPDYDNDNTVLTDINSLKTILKKWKGVNGVVEGAEFLGYEISDNNRFRSKSSLKNNFKQMLS